MSFSVTGTLFVRAERPEVWAALHDVAVIGACLPGCCSLRLASERVYALQVKVPLGPLGAVFDGTVKIIESAAPRNYRLEGFGAGPMGSAEGSATIHLEQQTGGCRVSYNVQAEARGPLRSIGTMVLAGAGKAIAMVFANRFAKVVSRARQAPFVIAHQ